MAVCPRTNCKNDAQSHSIYGILPCVKCQAKDTENTVIAKSPEFVNLSKQDRIQQQRDKNAKDIAQPWDGIDRNGNAIPNATFVKAYPEHRETYFSQKQLDNV